MRSYELECIHGVGHSGGVHGCDGCCGLIGIPAQDKERERIIAAVKPLISKGYFPPEEVGEGDWLEVEFSEFVALIKGEER